MIAVRRSDARSAAGNQILAHMGRARTYQARALRSRKASSWQRGGGRPEHGLRPAPSFALLDCVQGKIPATHTWLGSPVPLYPPSGHRPRGAVKDGHRASRGAEAKARPRIVERTATLFPCPITGHLTASWPPACPLGAGRPNMVRWTGIPSYQIAHLPEPSEQAFRTIRDGAPFFLERCRPVL